MNETCINPTEIHAGSLMAYVDGTADKTIIQHVRHCPACARQAAELTRLQATLTASLYRRSCPDTEQLIAYRYNELAGNEHLVVVQHLRQCPHCARELAALTHAERRAPGEWLRTAIKVIQAVLVPPQIQAAGVRNIPRMNQARPQVYRAAGIEIIVNPRPARTHPHQYDLVGLIHSAGQIPATIGTAEVELYHGAGLIAISQVSGRGQFTFAAVEPATYDLSLVWDQQEIQLPGMRVQ